MVDAGERAIAIDGRRFAWRLLGDGPPLLLVNGFAASSVDWDPSFLTALAGSFELICPDNRGTGASELGDVVAEARAAFSPATLAAQERVLDEWAATEQPPPGAGAPPALVVCGELDVVIPPANADALAALWPGARVERIAGGGHAFMAQEPQRVAALIADFAMAV